ncbi:MAG: hypothetical protein KY439_12040 [Actinobacteria bacterium]|nr:hypothetical protein [Actinomycetota bacterium]
MNRQTAVRIVVGGAVAGALGVTTILAGAEPPGGRYGYGDDGDGRGRGYRRGYVYAACKPGWGFGDRNHCHYGPPGLVGKQPVAGSDASSEEGTAEQADRNANAGNGNGKRHRVNQGVNAQPNRQARSEAREGAGGQATPEPNREQSGVQANPQPNPNREGGRSGPSERDAGEQRVEVEDDDASTEEREAREVDDADKREDEDADEREDEDADEREDEDDDEDEGHGKGRRGGGRR